MLTLGQSPTDAPLDQAIDRISRQPRRAATKPEIAPETAVSVSTQDQLRDHQPCCYRNPTLEGRPSPSCEDAPGL
nr:hypothetical protein JVH1_5031 [Rhodococcus sp. JVH1]